MYPPEAAGSEAPQHSNNVLEVAAEVFGQSVDSLNLHDGPDDIAGWDSLAHMRLVAKVEQRCRVRLSTAQIISIRTLRDLQEIVDQGASSA